MRLKIFARDWLWLGVLVPSLLGCSRQADLTYVSSKAVLELDAKLQTAVREQLDKFCGTPTSPKLIGHKDLDPHHLQRGAKIYQARCSGCHGTSGDGNGPAAAHLYPRPRDYRAGVFKFTSTPFGAKPLRSDLMQTIKQGALGTSMPNFNLLPEQDLEAVLDYVLVLTHRGELETLLALEAAGDDAVDPDNVEGYVNEILGLWKNAAAQVVLTATHEPPYSAESIEKGRKAFLTEEAGCYKCHGNDGRGQPASNTQEFKDSWGFQTRAADLSAGMFHGGGRSIDIYRRIYAGINGTPMPAFKQKLEKEPETFWNLAHYVQYISSARRRDVIANQPAAKVGTEFKAHGGE